MDKLRPRPTYLTNMIWFMSRIILNVLLNSEHIPFLSCLNFSKLISISQIGLSFFFKLTTDKYTVRA